MGRDERPYHPVSSWMANRFPWDSDEGTRNLAFNRLTLAKEEWDTDNLVGNGPEPGKLSFHSFLAVRLYVLHWAVHLEGGLLATYLKKK